MKEKFDLSLDSRQIVSMLIGGLVVLSAVFVLGVVVGKKLSTSEQASEAPDLLSALDQKAAAMEEVRGASSLTFEDELTKKAPSEPARLPDAPKVAPPAKAEPVKPTAPVENEKRSVVAAVPAPALDAGTPVAVAKLEAKATEPKVEPEPMLEPKADAKVADAKVAAKVEPKVKAADEAVTARTAPRDGGLKDALARAEKRPSEASPNGAFTLQLSASQSRAEADKFVAQLRSKGYAPYIQEAAVPGRGTWYRVRMGSFASRDAAQRYLTDFRRETQLEAFVAGN